MQLPRAEFEGRTEVVAGGRDDPVAVDRHGGQLHWGNGSA